MFLWLQAKHVQKTKANIYGMPNLLSDKQHVLVVLWQLWLVFRKYNYMFHVKDLKIKMFCQNQILFVLCIAGTKTSNNGERCINLIIV